MATYKVQPAQPDTQPATPDAAADPHVTPTLDSIGAKYLQSKETIGSSKLVLEPWHLPAIKAKHKIPGNKEMDETRFQELVQDVVDITIGGAAKPAKK